MMGRERHPKKSIYTSLSVFKKKLFLDQHRREEIKVMNLRNRFLQRSLTFCVDVKLMEMNCRMDARKNARVMAHEVTL